MTHHICFGRMNSGKFREPSKMTGVLKLNGGRFDLKNKIALNLKFALGGQKHLKLTDFKNQSIKLKLSVNADRCGKRKL